MNRRRFLSTLGAAVAALFVPGTKSAPIEPIFVPAKDYLAFVHPANMADLRLLNGEIGRWEGVRYIETRHV